MKILIEVKILGSRSSALRWDWLGVSVMRGGGGHASPLITAFLSLCSPVNQDSTDASLISDIFQYSRDGSRSTQVGQVYLEDRWFDDWQYCLQTSLPGYCGHTDRFKSCRGGQTSNIKYFLSCPAYSLSPIKYFPVLVFRRSDKLSDQLRSVQRSTGWLLLDPLHLSHQIWVPGQCGLRGGPRAHHREAGEVRGAGILHQLQQQPGLLHSGHFVLPVGSFHPHPPGCFILHTKKNMENLRGRTYGFIW